MAADRRRSSRLGCRDEDGLVPVSEELVFGFVRVRAGSPYPAILLHAVVNGVSLLA